MAEHNDIFQATPRNIWNYRQNHPELVIEDIENYLPVNMCAREGVVAVVRQSLLVRGVNKWLKVRRDLIAYKKLIKHRIKDLEKRIPVIKKEMSGLFIRRRELAENPTLDNIERFCRYENLKSNYLILKTQLKELVEVRTQLRSLCNTDRWQVWVGRKLEDMNSLKISD